MKTSTHKNVQIITENDLCISCGVCKFACPPKLIEISLNPQKQIYEPVIQDDGACLACDEKPCLQVCPSYEIDFKELASWESPNEMLGPALEIVTARSTSREITRRSSSGGLIKEICAQYLRTRQADAIIALSHQEDLEYAPKLYLKAEEMESAPGSIYHNINFEEATSLLQNFSGRVVLVAIPCQLSAIEKWMKMFPEKLKSKLVLKVGLICGWMFSRHSVQLFAKSQGLDATDLRFASYRGENAVGHLKLRTSTKAKEFNRRPEVLQDRHYSAYRTAFSRSNNLKRCHLCVEHLNYLADIAVGDAWLRSFRDNKEGTSILILRNEKAQQVVRALVGAGRIQTWNSGDHEIYESQSRDLALGIKAESLMRWARSKSFFVPHFKRPFETEHSLSLSDRFSFWYIPKIIRRLNASRFSYLFFLARLPWTLVKGVYIYFKLSAIYWIRRIFRAS